MTIIPFPIYGLMLGIHYLEDHEAVKEGKVPIHMIQICFFLIGFSIMWFGDAEDE